MVWALDLDDFSQGFPLISLMSSGGRLELPGFQAVRVKFPPPFLGAPSIFGSEKVGRFEVFPSWLPGLSAFSFGAEVKLSDAGEDGPGLRLGCPVNLI